MFLPRAAALSCLIVAIKWTWIGTADVASQGEANHLRWTMRTLLLGRTPTQAPEGTESAVLAALLQLANGPDPVLAYLAVKALDNNGLTEAHRARNAAWTQARRIADAYTTHGTDVMKDIAERGHRLGWVRLEYLPLARRKREAESSLAYTIVVEGEEGTAKTFVGRDERSVQPIEVRLELPPPSPAHRANWTTPAPRPTEPPPPAPTLQIQAVDTPTEAQGAARPYSTAPSNELEAYDCSVPTNLELVQVPDPEQCITAEAPNVLSEHPVEFDLLQESSTLQVPVKLCSVKRTVIPSYCGNFDYMTIDTLDLQINRNQIITPAECQRMHSELTLTVDRMDHNDQKIRTVLPLFANRTTQLQYDVVGTTWLESNEIQCHGSYWWSEAGQKYVDNMMVSHGDDVTLREDVLLLDGQRNLDVLGMGIRLPASCRIEEGYCVTDEGTYMWDPPPEQGVCRMHRIRRLKGTELAVLTGDEVTFIVNDDERMVRLERRGSVHRCGTFIHETNFPDLYLASNDPFGPAAAQFDRPLPAHEVKLGTYFNQQSGWLHGHFMGRLRDYVTDLFQAKCRKEKAELAAQYADMASRQSSATDGVTLSLGGGYFATAAGEAWRRYRCPSITVLATNRDRCYDALPVILAGPTRIPNATAVEWYMEPRTRILTNVASEVVCSELLAPVYRNKEGGWIQATPAILASAAPRVLEPDLPKEVDGNEQPLLPDFVNGGIYTDRQLEQAQNRRTEHRRAQEAIAIIGAVVNPIAEAPPSARQREYIDRLIHEAPAIQPILAITTSAVWAFLHEYGLVMSAIVGTYCAYNIVIRLWHTLYRWLFPTHGYTGCCGRFIGALFPWLTSAIYESMRPTKSPPSTATDEESDGANIYAVPQKLQPKSEMIDAPSALAPAYPELGVNP